MGTCSRLDDDLDFKKFVCNEKRQKTITQEVLFNDKDIHARLNKWIFINNLIDDRNGTNSTNMQDLHCHS